MKIIILILLFFSFYSLDSSAGCERPFGKFEPKIGSTVLEISSDQTLKITKVEGGISKIIYTGKFTNFDEMNGTEYLNFVNAIDVEPFDKKQSHICLHVNDDCSGMKVGICRRALELFGGEPPKLEARYFLKND